MKMEKRKTCDRCCVIDCKLNEKDNNERRVVHYKINFEQL